MSQRFDYYRGAPDVMKAFGAVHGLLSRSGLSAAFLELVYLRVSQINGCAYCIDMHTASLLKAGVAVEKLMLASVWREAGTLFDGRERAALAWAESVTDVARTQVPDEAYRAAAAVFDETELSELTAAIALMNAYNRLGVSARNVPSAASTEALT